MRTTRNTLLLVLAMIPFVPFSPPGGTPRLAESRVEVIDRNGQPTGRITDGDTIQLRLQTDIQQTQTVSVTWVLDEAGQTLAFCSIPIGGETCQSEPFAALGWYWGSDGEPHPVRVIRAASSEGSEILGQTSVAVAPRPVVLVHGFSSSWEAWATYLGPSGYLAQHGLAGFAVGDGQTAGTLNTGSLSRPTATTNTIFENAAILGEYIAGVKRSTGAQMVDLVAHSMGGLIARAYLDRVMSGRDVAQLIMLGSPMAGTDCANLPAALGLYLPATLELRPSYVRQIFNPQVSRRHGVPFHALAGVPIVEGFQSPCTDVPTDLAVSRASVSAIPLDSTETPVLHMELNTSQPVFDDFVLGWLRTPAGNFAATTDPASSAPVDDGAQFSRVFSGHLAPGASAELTIPIDAGIRVAGFALYDTSRTLQVQVTGASGNVIELSTERNGLVVVDDPAALLYLGYGFQDPRPGEWRVRLETGQATPAEGSDYALTARFLGGAQLEAGLDSLSPEVGQAVALSARLLLGSQAVPLQSAAAELRAPDGAVETIELDLQDGQALGSLRPRRAGLYGVDVTLSGLAPDGTRIERTAFLAFEAQARSGGRLAAWAAVVAALLLIGIGLIALRRRRRGPLGT